MAVDGYDYVIWPVLSRTSRIPALRVGHASFFHTSLGHPNTVHYLISFVDRADLVDDDLHLVICRGLTIFQMRNPAEQF
jgi:hypothetical protein